MMDDTADEAPDGADEIATLFDDYRDGFEDFDAQAIADCFAYPAVIWQLGKGNLFADDEDILENIEKLLDLLDGEGIAATRYELLEASADEAGGSARLEWTQSRADGEEAFRFICRYGLVRDADGVLRIGFLVNE